MSLPLSPEVGAKLLLEARERLLFHAAGGKGSGNFGHSGRPGQQGGSSSGDTSYSPDERKAIEEWVGPLIRGEEGEVSSLEVQNITLREGGKLRGADKELADSLSKAIDRTPVKEDTILYRGIFDDDIPEGDEFVDRGFVATSGDKEYAGNFGDSVWEIRVPKGTGVLDINSVVKMEIESEKLLQRGLTFKVDRENKVLTVIKKPIKALGGPGSGNFGHSGRPGERGGSSSSLEPWQQGGFAGGKRLPSIKSIRDRRFLFRKKDGYVVLGEEYKWWSSVSPYPKTEERVRAQEADELDTDEFEEEHETSHGDALDRAIKLDPTVPAEYDSYDLRGSLGTGADGKSFIWITTGMGNELMFGEATTALVKRMVNSGGADKDTVVKTGQWNKTTIGEGWPTLVGLPPLSEQLLKKRKRNLAGAEPISYPQVPALKQRSKVLEWFTRLLGGAGSGNFGHAGRPGERGGSASKDVQDKADAILSQMHKPMSDKEFEDFVEKSKDVDLPDVEVVEEVVEDYLGDKLRRRQRVKDNGAKLSVTDYSVNDPKASEKLVGKQDPVDVALRMFDALPGDNVRVEVRPSSDEDNLAWRMDVKARSAEAHIQREFVKYADGTFVVTHTEFELDPVHQGSGIAKKILKASMKEYEAIGVTEIKTYANLDVGGYAWAKFGFVAEDPEALARQVSTAILGRSLPNRAVEVNPESRDKLLAVVKQHAEDPKLPWVLAGLTDGDDPIGKRLLMSTAWDAKLDMKDEEAMGRFRHYVNKRDKRGPKPRRGPRGRRSVRDEDEDDE